MLEGVEAERSRRSAGTASRAREGVMLGEGDCEPARCSGEVMSLAGGLGVLSAISKAFS